MQQLHLFVCFLLQPVPTFRFFLNLPVKPPAETDIIALKAYRGIKSCLILFCVITAF